MSEDILKPINNIKTSINKNDQILWECQASAKCYTEAAENLKEKCERLNKEIARIEEEIREIEPQTESLSHCCLVLVEGLAVNQESLVNQRLYRNCIKKDIKRHQEEVNRITDEYAQYFQKRKDKLEITNPTYKSLQIKKAELKKCKIRCLDVTKKIDELRNVYKKIVEVRKTLFYGDIIAFGKIWLAHKKYVEMTAQLDEVKLEEREYMRKLMEATEQFNQKKKEGYYRKEMTFKIPQIEFPRDGISKDIKATTETGKRHFSDPFSDIKTLLEKKDFNTVNRANVITQKCETKINLQTLKFNANESKIRILENKTLTLPQRPEERLIPKSKEERSKTIAEKLQKVVQNFTKSISRQSSKRNVNFGAGKSRMNETNREAFNENCSQHTNASQESLQFIGNVELPKSNTTDINRNQPELNMQSQVSNGCSQPSKSQQQTVSQPGLDLQRGLSNRTGIPKGPATSFATEPANTSDNKALSQDNNISSKIGSSSDINSVIPPVKKFSRETEKATVGNTLQPSTSGHKFSFLGQKSEFFPSFSSGFGDRFNKCANNSAKAVNKLGNDKENIPFKKPESAALEKSTILAQSKPANEIISNSNGSKIAVTKDNNVFADNTRFMMSVPGNELSKNLTGLDTEPPGMSSAHNGNLMNMGGVSYNFGNDTQFSQMLNSSYDYEAGYISPQFDESCVTTQADEGNMATGFNNATGFSRQMFSFGQINPFKF